MLRPRPAGRPAGGHDMQFRMHLLRGLRQHTLARCLPELPWESDAAPVTYGTTVAEIPGVHTAGAQLQVYGSRRVRGAAVLMACVLFSACAEVPAPGPSLTSGPLQGSIAAGVYRDKRDWFSIGIPFQEEGRLYPYVQVQEVTPTNISFVNFSSLNNPGEYYRVYAEDFFASNHQVPDMDHLADAVLQVYGRQ